MGPQNPPASIPPAELDVLACVWKEGPVVAKRIKAMMSKYRPMAHGSVVTLLTRLEEKGLVAKKKGPVGKAFLFFPGKSPEIIHRKLAKDMVTRVFAGNPATMITALLDVHQATHDEMAQIQKAVSSAKRKARKGTRK